MLVMNPATAMAETRRVLRPGGRLAFSVWAAPEDNPWASVISHILVANDYMTPPAPGTPGIFALANPDRVRALVMEAGFADPVIEMVPTHRRFPTFDAYWRYLTDLAGAISPVLRGLSPEEQIQIREILRNASAQFLQDGRYDFPGLCLNAVTT
jgi:hypothetical protein